MLNSTNFVYNCISFANHSAAILRAYQSCGLVIWRGVAFYRSLFISQTTLSAMNPGFKLFTLSLKCLLKIQNEAVFVYHTFYFKMWGSILWQVLSIQASAVSIWNSRSKWI